MYLACISVHIPGTKGHLDTMPKTPPVRIVGLLGESATDEYRLQNVLDAVVSATT